jgi:ABC-type antimicrobial peptide transport system permease subunit
MGVNDIEAFSLLSAEDIKWADGIPEDFLQGQQAGAIVDEVFLQDNDLHIGDEVNLSLYSLDFGERLNELYYRNIDDIAIEIVGSFTITGTAQGTVMMPNLICSVGWAEELLRAYDMDIYADSANFVVSEPLKLNEFKRAMDDLGFQSVNAQADSYSLGGIGLLVNDETFVRSAGSLQKNLTIMRVFMPFIILLIVLVGYIASYLVMQSRRMEVAVMRSLGVDQKNCILVLSAENAVLILLGCLIGVVAAVRMTGIGIWEMLMVTIVFFASYMGGVVAALLKLCRFSVMEVLTRSE